MFRLVCLGDSLTFGYGVSREEAWPSLLGKEIGCAVVNAGICGDTTGGMLARFVQVSQGVDAVCIMGGFNDFALGTPLGQVRANIFSMVQQSFALGRQAILGIATPVQRQLPFSFLRSISPHVSDEICDEFRAWLLALATDFSLPVFNFYDRFQGLQGGVHLYRDALHPSVDGHKEMAREAVAVLQSLL